MVDEIELDRLVRRMRIEAKAILDLCDKVTLAIVAPPKKWAGIADPYPGFPYPGFIREAAARAERKDKIPRGGKLARVAIPVATNAAADVFAEACTLHRDVPHVVKAAPKRRAAKRPVK